MSFSIYLFFISKSAHLQIFALACGLHTVGMQAGFHIAHPTPNILDTINSYLHSMKKRSSLLTLLLLSSFFVFAQKKSATVSGKVLDDNENPLAKVSIVILGKTTGTITNDSGFFTIKVPADRAVALVFSYAGYKTEQRNLYLSEKETENIIIRLEPGAVKLSDIVISDQKERREVGNVRINPKLAVLNPSPIAGVESLIKVFVGSNNELTSQYSVRGGSFDENLIYVNDFEVFRPYLVRSGQQEGLSFINPELVQSLNFYNGGFQSKYGDKMSSVLDIKYRRPKKFGGSAYVSLLEQGLHLEGVSKNDRFSYLIGVRQRTNQNLLSSQEVKGSYIPSSTDLQALLTYRVSNTWNLELLGNLSTTKFKLTPEFAQKSSSVFSPLFAANIGLDIYFEGKEEDKYQTNMIGISAENKVNDKLKLKWMLSRFENKEKEAFDISGAYLFGERSFDKSSPDFGLIVNPLGAGVFQNYARNKLDIEVLNASHKGSYSKGKHFYQWGLSAERQSINDKLNEWEFQDSAGYSLPFKPNGNLQLNKVLKSTADINLTRFSGYIQDNIILDPKEDVTLQAGVRFNYNTLNSETIISPRAQLSWKPSKWKRDVVFKIAGGIYDQPPFYRELRRYDGTVNKDLKSQKSWQAVTGLDYAFQWNKRPFRFTAEAYYKGMNDVVPYDIDNVRIRYFGENKAKAYAAGVEFRLFGEFVKDAESWISLGFMQTKENIDGDSYYRYKNAAGEFITAESSDQVVADSVKFDVGYVRRPSDRFVTFGMYFQDYLNTNKNFKVFLNLIYGSNLPYNIPNSTRYRNALKIDQYIRADLGLSFLLLDPEKSNRRSHSPFRNFESIWGSLEIFNLIDRPNTISYQFIKDFSNNVFAIPNRLTPRLVNLKLLARF